MYTDCPACSRQFRIRAWQLSAANGEVKCGYCGEQFNALLRLRDKPLPTGEITAPVILDEEFPEPEFYIPTSAEDNGVAENPEPSGDIKTDEPGPVFVLQKEGPASGVQKKVKTAGPEDEFPAELLENDNDKHSLFSRIIWSFSVLVLLLAAVTQLSWFHRDEILTRYPELIPYTIQLCEKLHCRVIRFRDVAAIKLMNRDVRDHPRYKDALLVNATMMNQAGAIQPYPRIQLGLFDTDGRLIAFREFTPGSYLDESININDGMVPGRPVHFVLEVTGPTRGAVSFEFRFL